MNNVYKTHFKKILSLREQQLVEKYYRPLKMTKDTVAYAILESRRMGISIENIISTFEDKIIIQSLLSPEDEMKWLLGSIDSMSIEEKNRFNKQINSSGDEEFIKMFGNR